MTEFSDRPFAAGSVFGLRSFLITADGTLTGVSVQELWSEGENSADCFPTTYWGPSYHPRVDLEPDHRRAAKDCTCGFYAYYDGSNQYRGSMGLLTVTGIIEGYGLVTVGSRGFRAEKARIRALVFPLPFVKYPDVPVFATEDEALAAYPLTKPEDVGVELSGPLEDRGWRIVGYSMGGLVRSAAASAQQVQHAMHQLSQAMQSCTQAMEAFGEVADPEHSDPVERKRLAAEEAAQRRAAAGLKGVGGFDKRGRRR